jgi:hypothetical protein
MRRHFILLGLTIWFAIFATSLIATEDAAGRRAASQSGASWPPGCTEPVPTPPRYLVASRIGIQTPAEAEAKRQELIDFIWSGQGFPSSDKLGVRTNVANPIRSVDLQNLAGVDELIVRMDGFESHAFRFRPLIPNGYLVIYHAGHSDDLGNAGGDRAILAFLQRGFEVVGFYMPGYGPNTTLPALPDDARRHDYFATLETPTFSPLRYFMEPVAVVLNFVTRQQAFTDIRMIGISGGGWTTTLYAAIDPRIRVSYPIAGTLPLELRSATCGAPEMGDWEQSGSRLYELVDYTELYVLGAHGEGRKQRQILNEFDPCCFWGWGTRYSRYEHAVRRTLRTLGGGSFRVVLDSSTRGVHAISPWALDEILPPDHLNDRH